MVSSATSKMVAGDSNLIRLNSANANGKIDQLTPFIENGSNRGRFKDESKYLDEDIKYPRSVFFIISNEFCERFCFYGMRAVLGLYLHQILNYSVDESTVIYHSFLMAAYFFPIFGAILADSFVGKFRTIFYLSVIYAIGNITLSLSSTPFSGLSPRYLTAFGLVLIAIGTGGIKPCVSAFGGDQFVLPQQEKQLKQFFSVFYFSINAGSLISIYVTPYIRYNVHCFGSKNCYPLAFGVPAILMIVSLVIFVLGKRFYIIKKQEGNILVKVIKCISHALVNKISNKGEKKSHWLNYAEDKFDKILIEEIKSFLQVLLLFLPLPVYWALFDQQGSRWTFQATQMDGSLGWFGSIKPEQVQIINPFLILFLIPLFETVIYPLLAKFKLIERPLQKIAVGGLLTALAFVFSGLVELRLQDTYEVLPGNGYGQIRIYNGLNCSVSVDSTSIWLQGTIKPYEALQIKKFPIEEFPNLPLLVKTKCPLVPSNDSSQTWLDPIKIGENNNSSVDHNMTLSYLITGNPLTQINSRMFSGKEDVSKSKNGIPKFRILYNIRKSINITMYNDKAEEVAILSEHSISTPFKLVPDKAGKYQIKIDNKVYGDFNLRLGGVYTLLLIENDNDYVLNLSTVQEPNSLHMLWQIPQYVLITASEVMVSVTGLELSYSQAPSSMKSVLSATWLLTTSLGNLIVIVIAELRFSTQATEFFSFALMMTIVMGVFMIIAKQYTYVNVSNEETEDLQKSKTNENGLSQYSSTET